jgi:transposase
MKGSRSMQQITTIGLDLAKQVFQVHGAEADGGPVVSRKLRRADVLNFFKDLSPCLVGMEACGGAIASSLLLRGAIIAAAPRPP